MSIQESRRRFLYQNLVGVGGIALMELLHRDLFAAGPVNEKPLAPKTPHHTPKAKSCIFLSMLGGVAQMDTFDPKAALKKFDGTPMDWSKHKKTDQPGLFAKPRHLVASPFSFSKHGKCGMDVSDLLPNLASCVDDMAFVRSVQADNGNHPAAVFQMNTGLVELRARNCESEFARVCRPARFSFSSVQWFAAMGKRFFAGIIPGDRLALERRPHSRPGITN
jgi:hypothetical protein